MKVEVTLQKIRDFADNAHGLQMRKYMPERYIVHPVRVMELCKLHNQPLPVLAAALLHDVLEDTEVGETEMASFLDAVMPSTTAARQVLELVIELTDVYTNAAYPQWNRRVRKEHELERIARTSLAAQTIKYADIIDNCREIVKYDKGFAPKFLKECRAILQVAPLGDQQLYNQAVQVIDAGLKQL